MLLEDDNFCFVCGIKNPAGLQLNFSLRDNRVFAEFTLPKIRQGYKDIVHGGIITTILDEAMMKAALAKGIHAITAELTVRFKNPLRVMEKALVEAEITKTRGKLIEAAASIIGPDSKAIANGNGKLLIR